jgi:hypothetical protein
MRHGQHSSWRQTLARQPLPELRCQAANGDLEQEHSPGNTMTTDYKSLCIELMDAIDSGIPVERIKQSPLAVRVDAALAQPEPVGPTDDDCIDRDITGSDQDLLRQFYAAAQREGGSTDEVTLRGIRAVLNRPQAPEPTIEELAAMWLEQYGNVSGSPTMNFSEFVDAARAVLARWGRPTLTPIPVSERLPGPEDCAPWPGEPKATPWAWAAKCVDNEWEWVQLSMLGLGSDALARIIAGGGWTHWLPFNALPLPGQPARDA